MQHRRRVRRDSRPGPAFDPATGCSTTHCLPMPVEAVQDGALRWLYHAFLVNDVRALRAIDAPTSACRRRNSPGVQPTSRLKNLTKLVGSWKPRRSPIRAIDKAVCARSRFASRLIRDVMKAFALTPATSIAARVKTQQECIQLMA